MTVSEIMGKHPRATFPHIQEIMSSLGESIPNSINANVVNFEQLEEILYNEASKVHKEENSFLRRRSLTELKILTGQKMNNKRKEGSLPQLCFSKGSTIKKKIVRQTLDDEISPHDDFIKKTVVGVSLPLSSYDAIKNAVKSADLRACLDSGLLLHIYYHLDDNDNLQNFFVNNVVEKYIKNKILTKTAENESEMDCKLLAIYKNAKTEYSSFDILNSQDFILNWNDVMFRKRHYVINPPRIGNIKFRPLIIDDEMSCPAFNEAGIKAFLQQRLPHIHCVAKENALTVLDKIDLAVAFHYMKTVNVKDSLERHRKKNKKSLFKFKIKNFMDAIKQGEYYNKAQLHKLKSRYVSFLASY